MKTHLIAAEISRLVPELARDSIVNRETLIKGILDEAKAQDENKPSVATRQYNILLKGFDDSTTFKMELNDEEASTLQKVSDLTHGCMPTMEIHAAAIIKSF